MVTKKLEDNATQLCENLCDELEAAAEAGNLAEVTQLLNEYKNNSQKYDPDIFKIMVGNALWRSCEMGHLECVKILQPACRKKDMFHAVMGACNYGNTQTLDFLLSVYKWENAATKKDALLCAVSSGSIETVKYMLNQTSNKTHRNEALCEASIIKNREIFDLLCPLSSPQVALKFMDKNPEATEDDKQMLKDEIAQQQNIMLSEAIGETVAKPGRKNKI